MARGSDSNSESDSNVISRSRSRDRKRDHAKKASKNDTSTAARSDRHLKRTRHNQAGPDTVNSDDSSLQNQSDGSDVSDPEDNDSSSDSSSESQMAKAERRRLKKEKKERKKQKRLEKKLKKREAKKQLLRAKLKREKLKQLKASKESNVDEDWGTHGKIEKEMREEKQINGGGLESHLKPVINQSIQPIKDPGDPNNDSESGNQMNHVKKEEVNFAASGLLAMEDAFQREAALQKQQEIKQIGASGVNNNSNGPGLSTKSNRPNIGEKNNFRFQDVQELLKTKGKKLTLPVDARIPDDKQDGKWRIYVFVKGSDDPKIAHLKGQAEWYFGKDRTVVDIPTDHPTCSKQHAVIHFRQKGDTAVPYLMDLESTNGTFLNGEKMEAARYYEVFHQDKVCFASSSRDYIFMKVEK